MAPLAAKAMILGATTLGLVGNTNIADIGL